jgi:hypothetical protein
MTTTIDRRDLMRLSLLTAAVNLLPAGAAPGAAGGQDPKRRKTMTGDAPRDFDFLAGSWKVRHRRLKERLAGSTEWEEFDGTCVMQKLMGGFANVDDNVLHLPGGSYRAVGLRSYDPEARTWAIWWLDGRDPHVLDVPVVGAFKDGVGTFQADDTLRGKPIKMKFVWSHVTPTSAQWEQSFSPDGGRTWEMNWHMDFTRTA